MNLQNVSSFLKNSENGTLLDIRSKKDFLKGHLPNAISIPFPINLKELRQSYGTEINNGEIDLFIENFGEWRKRVSSYLVTNSLCFVYCQTGGLRSFYFHQTLQVYSADIYFLKGGYQAYCEFQNQYFEEIIFPNLYVLKGKTGSGKTATLRALANIGEQVINLSDLAKHQGSVFGNLIGEEQPASDQFQHNLLQECLRIDIEKPVYTESEGAFIGSVSLPDSFYKQLIQGKIIELNIPKKARASYLLKQYSDLKTNEVLKALKKIQGRLSPSNYSKAIQFLIQGKRHDFVILVMAYYDQSVSYRKDSSNVFQSFPFSEVDPFKSAMIINKNFK